MKKLFALVFTACCGFGAATAQSGALPPLDDAQVRHYLASHPEHAAAFSRGAKGEWTCTDPAAYKACVNASAKDSGPRMEAAEEAPALKLTNQRREEPSYAKNERQLANELRDRINADPANAERHIREYKELLQQRNAQNHTKH